MSRWEWSTSSSEASLMVFPDQGLDHSLPDDAWAFISYVFACVCVCVRPWQIMRKDDPLCVLNPLSFIYKFLHKSSHLCAPSSTHICRCSWVSQDSLVFQWIKMKKKQTKKTQGKVERGSSLPFKGRNNQQVVTNIKMLWCWWYGRVGKKCVCLVDDDDDVSTSWFPPVGWAETGFSWFGAQWVGQHR